jgi:glutathione peroxidase-family protein
MFRGFRVYEETYYVLLKRYDSLEANKNNENERMNLLSKLKSLAECMQDEFIKYNFTKRLIQERSDRIVNKFDDIKINTSKSMYKRINIAMKIITKRTPE